MPTSTSCLKENSKGASERCNVREGRSKAHNAAHNELVIENMIPGFIYIGNMVCDIDGVSTFPFLRTPVVVVLSMIFKHKIEHRDTKYLE